MKVFIRIIFYAAAFLNIFTLSGCSVKNKYKNENIKMPSYAQVTAVENKGDKEEIFNVNSSGLIQNESVHNLWEMKYNSKNSVFVYLMGAGENWENGSKIVVLQKNTKSEIKDFFAASDVKMNFSGDKIAYRTFKDSSMGSAQGMKVYDLKNKKQIQLKSRVLVSGNLYEWLDDHRIIYYGSVEGEKNSDKIYLYDFSKDREQVYLDGIRGYCTYFVPIGNNLLILSRDQDEVNLYYYNYRAGKFVFLDNKFQQIYDPMVNRKNGSVFFVGKDAEDRSSLYEFTENNGKLSRITYDFPGEISESSGMAQDKAGNVYFVGMENTGDGQNVFMYDINEKSINIISDHQGKYNIYREN